MMNLHQIMRQYTMVIDNDSVSAAVQNMINRYGDRALIEVELRIEELKSLKHKDALELWIEVRKVMCSQLKEQIGVTKH